MEAFQKLQGFAAKEEKRAAALRKQARMLTQEAEGKATNAELLRGYIADLENTLAAITRLCPNLIIEVGIREENPQDTPYKPYDIDYAGMMALLAEQDQQEPDEQISFNEHGEIVRSTLDAREAAALDSVDTDPEEQKEGKESPDSDPGNVWARMPSLAEQRRATANMLVTGFKSDDEAIRAGIERSLKSPEFLQQVRERINFLLADLSREQLKKVLRNFPNFELPRVRGYGTAHEARLREMIVSEAEVSQKAYILLILVTAVTYESAEQNSAEELSEPEAE